MDFLTSFFLSDKGDLGAIDQKYDVAISTACGPLDFVVVDTIETASKCVQFLKRNNVGSTTFIALDKVLIHSFILSSILETYRVIY